MAEIIGVITSVEDDNYQGKDFKVVTLGTGQVLKVKYGRDGVLKAKWGLLKEGIAIKFTMMDYTKPDGIKIPFVSDIATVEGEIPEHQPVSHETEPVPSLVQEAVKLGAKVIGHSDVKNRAVSISYAKDLAAAGKIELKDMRAYADKFLEYIEG